MTDAQLIYRWQLAKSLAAQLKMTLDCNASGFYVHGTEGGNSFKGSHSTDSLNEILGFLNGVLEAKRVLTTK